MDFFYELCNKECFKRISKRFLFDFKKTKNAKEWAPYTKWLENKHTQTEKFEIY